MYINIQIQSRTKNEEDGVLDKEKLIINIKEVIHIWDKTDTQLEIEQKQMMNSKFIVRELQYKKKLNKKMQWIWDRIVLHSLIFLLKYLLLTKSLKCQSK